MCTHRRLPRALDGALLAGLSESEPECRPTATFDWREVRRRGRARINWEALVASGIAHVLIFLALSVSILTIDVSRIEALLVRVMAEPEAVPLETLDSGPGRSDSVVVEGMTFASIGVGDPFAESSDTDLGLADLALPPVSMGPTIPIGGALFEPVKERKERPSTASPAPGDEGTKEGPPKAEYFGTVAHGDRFVYVVDRSGSMQTRTQQQSENRFERAVAELLQSLEQLQPDQSFYVILFSDGTHRMFDDKSSPPRMRRATRHNKDRLRRWVTAIAPGGGTQPRTAIRLALSMNPSAVFLLSDGQFNGFGSFSDRGQVFHADPLAGKLLGEAAGERVPIHSFAFEDPSAKDNMRGLAALTGGRYRYIEPREAADPVPPQPAAAPQPAIPPEQRLATPPPRSPAALLAYADQARDAGQYQLAMQAYQELLRMYPMTSAGAKARGRIIQLSRRAWTRR